VALPLVAAATVVAMEPRPSGARNRPPGVDAGDVRLVINPAGDRRFVAAVRAAMSDGGGEDVAALEARLRKRYPTVVVRERGLSDEGRTWYVYRDGHWEAAASAPRLSRTRSRSLPR
jgi:hypothetical protein